MMYTVRLSRGCSVGRNAKSACRGRGAAELGVQDLADQLGAIDEAGSRAHEAGVGVDRPHLVAALPIARGRPGVRRRERPDVSMGDLLGHA